MTLITQYGRLLAIWYLEAAGHIKLRKTILVISKVSRPLLLEFGGTFVATNILAVVAHLRLKYKLATHGASKVLLHQVKVLSRTSRIKVL